MTPTQNLQPLSRRYADLRAEFLRQNPRLDRLEPAQLEEHLQSIGKIAQKDVEQLVAQFQAALTEEAQQLKGRQKKKALRKIPYTALVYAELEALKESVYLI